MNKSTQFVKCGDYVFFEKSPCGAEGEEKARFSEFRRSLRAKIIQNYILTGLSDQGRKNDSCSKRSFYGYPGVLSLENLISRLIRKIASEALIRTSGLSA